MRRITVVLIALSINLAACSSAPPDRSPARASSRHSAIIGGSVDDASKAVVGLGVGINNFFFGHCTGTLILPNLVLTARHCVALTQSPGQYGSVICGQTSFTLQGPGSIFRATTLTVRPKADNGEFYKGIGKVFVDTKANDICGFDMALIVLDGKGVPASEAVPIEPRIEEPAQADELMSAVGYGLTVAGGSDAGDVDGTRMRIDGRKVLCTEKGCTASLVKTSEFGTDAPTCQGDSGGPALDSQGRVFGVLSRGPNGCQSSVYGDVAHNKDLVITAALAALKSSGLDPPAWLAKYVPEPDAGASDGNPGEAGSGGDGSGTAGDGAQPSSGGCASAPGQPTLGALAALLFALALLLLARRYRRRQR